ncbi:MAG: hypothetical protein LBH19_02370 [Dysgonamonadaceae bacterium]|jgi:outer membrane lipoprotein-sorting protein|nr:hypothetical protein [Dysgonamonadaceae bacterium]
MKSFINKMRKVATIVACLAVTTAFASCEPADEPAPNAPAFAEFSFASQRGTADIDAKKRTVKAVAECGTNLAALAPAFKLSPDGATATVDGKPQESGRTANNFADAVVYKLAAPDGTTAEWTVTVTLPDDCPTPDVAYNPPADYYIERKGKDGDIQKYFKIGNNYTYIHPDGLTEHFSGETMYEYGTTQGSTVWYRLDDSEEAHREAVTAALAEAAKPLNDFFEILYLFKGNRDGATAKQFYVRTEKLLERDCGVYELYDNGQLGHGKCRVWVDLATGCWLKYQNTDEKTTFEVLVFKLTGLEWNTTLRPIPYSSAIIP